MSLNLSIDYRSEPSCGCVSLLALWQHLAYPGWTTQLWQVKYQVTSEEFHRGQHPLLTLLALGRLQFIKELEFLLSNLLFHSDSIFSLCGWWGKMNSCFNLQVSYLQYDCNYRLWFYWNFFLFTVMLDYTVRQSKVLLVCTPFLLITMVYFVICDGERKISTHFQ